MNNLHKKIVLPVLGLSLAGATIFGATQVSAAYDSSNGSPMASLIEKIAAKFNLNQTDVKAVFDQDRADHETQREAKYEEQLNQYVTDGKITNAQKDLILAKHKEMEASRDSKMADMKDKTPEERKSEMDAERTALQQWATQNGIDLKYLMGHGGSGRGFGGHHHDGLDSSTTPTVTPAG